MIRIILTFLFLFLSPASLTNDARTQFAELECKFENHLCSWTSPDLVTFSSYGDRSANNGPLFNYIGKLATHPVQLYRPHMEDTDEEEEEDPTNQNRLEIMRSASLVSAHPTTTTFACLQFHMYAFHPRTSSYVSILSRLDGKTEWNLLFRLHNRLHIDRWNRLHVRVPSDSKEIRLVSNVARLHLGSFEILDAADQCESNPVCDFETDGLCSVVKTELDSSYFSRVSCATHQVLQPQKFYPSSDSTTRSVKGHFLTVAHLDKAGKFEQPLVWMVADESRGLRFQLYKPIESRDRLQLTFSSPVKDDRQDRRLVVWTSEEVDFHTEDQWQTVRVHVKTKIEAHLVLEYFRNDVNERVLAVDDMQFENELNPSPAGDCTFETNFCGYEQELSEANVHWQIGSGRLVNPDQILDFNAPPSTNLKNYAFLDLTSLDVPDFTPSTATEDSFTVRLLSERIDNCVPQFCVHFEFNLQMRMSSGTLTVGYKANHPGPQSIVRPLNQITFANEHNEWTPVQLTGQSDGPFRLVFAFTTQLNQKWRPFASLRNVKVRPGMCGSSIDDEPKEQQAVKLLENFLKLNCNFIQSMCSWANQFNLGGQFVMSAKEITSFRQSPVDASGGKCEI